MLLRGGEPVAGIGQYSAALMSETTSEIRNIHAAHDWFEVLHTSRQSQTAVMILAPGAASGEEPEAHAHSEQTLLVVTGSISGEVGEEKLTLGPGDVITIPAGVKHRFRNDGTQPALTFNVYSPPEYPPDARG